MKRLVDLVEQVAVDRNADCLRRLAGGEGEGSSRRRVVTGRVRGAVGRRVLDGHLRPLTGVRATVNVALTVPESPSVTVTSSIESDGSGSLSMIVPTPLASAIVALTAFARPTRERLVGLVERGRG